MLQNDSLPLVMLRRVSSSAGGSRGRIGVGGETGGGDGHGRKGGKGGVVGAPGGSLGACRPGRQCKTRPWVQGLSGGGEGGDEGSSGEGSGEGERGEGESGGSGSEKGCK